MSNNYVRSAASYRQEARIALKGKWEVALVVGLILALIGGTLFGASVNFEFTSGYSTLDVKLGPYFSETYWCGDLMLGDLADELDPSERPGLVPFSAGFLLSAFAVATVLLILLPVYEWGLARLSLYPHIAQPIEPSLLKIGWHEYWKMVGAQIRVSLSIIWLPLLILLTAIPIGILLEAPVIIVIAAIPAVVISLMRVFYYVPVSTLLVLCPEKSNKDILSDSRRMMNGHRGRFFGLGLSFFGWALLEVAAVSAITSIGTIPGMPVIAVSLINALAGALSIPLLIYTRTAHAAFFLDRMGMSNWQEPAESAAQAPKNHPRQDDRSYEAPLTQEQYDLMYGTPEYLRRDEENDRADRDDDRRDDDRRDDDDRADNRFDRDDRDDDRFDRFRPICYDDGSDDSPSDDGDSWSDDDDSSSDDDSSGSDDD